MSKQKTLRNRKKLIAVVAAILAAGTILTIQFLAREKPVEVTTERSFRKEVVHVVTATGKVEPETEVAISPDVSGEII